jgi:hypothetical protein
MKHECRKNPFQQLSEDPQGHFHQLTEDACGPFETIKDDCQIFLPFWWKNSFKIWPTLQWSNDCWNGFFYQIVF